MAVSESDTQPYPMAGPFERARHQQLERLRFEVRLAEKQLTNIRKTELLWGSPAASKPNLRVSVLCALTRHEPFGSDGCRHDQFQDCLRRHRDPRFVVQPGLKRDLQGIGQELSAIVAIHVFANVAKPRGQVNSLSSLKFVLCHAPPLALTQTILLADHPQGF
jgi:hypothetical protein